ncbi:unnamed protein product [Prorocentrum cordatum]|uniref:Amine oxidase n=1 Tax=Prorocentrum cordatum TaxID=2364126 RepID=A0ABN9TTK9_9DINO|nr:unnamed protein product [Polarella glacialis]
MTVLTSAPVLALIFLAPGVGAAGPGAAFDLGVVGAGAGGAYAAWRAAVAGKSVCVFERAGRPGGRIHSLRGQGPRKDLVVEAGGYRFAPKPVHMHTGKFDWTISTPITAAVINELNLTSVSYNPNASDWDHGMHKIVGADGQDVGYLTFIERLLDLAVAHGAKVLYNTTVVGLGMKGEGVLLRHSGGEALAKSVVLNLPQRPAIELLRGSDPSIASHFPRPLYDPVSYPIMKLYVHYDDAWWRNDLGLVAGPFMNTEPPQTGRGHTFGVPTVSPVPLQGQYHDGHVRCESPPSRGCRGYLQAFYGGDNAMYTGGVDGAMKFFAPFADTIAADSVTHIGRDQPHHVELLEALHSSLLGLHRPALDAVNATGRVANLRPTSAVLSMWTEGVAGINAGCHAPKRLPGGESPPPDQLPKAALEPMPGLPVLVANEAFGPVGCFAEGSLSMAEAAVKRLYPGLRAVAGLPEDLQAAGVAAPPTDPSLLLGRAAMGSPELETLQVI